MVTTCVHRNVDTPLYSPDRCFVDTSFQLCTAERCSCIIPFCLRVCASVCNRVAIEQRYLTTGGNTNTLQRVHTPWPLVLTTFNFIGYLHRLSIVQY